ncbi:prolyl aminopeptidase [Amycolatopsis jejuensis]|uniref:prolyl aminopeptidase n=1 Tax=Amycolatopsis jejuensis TaxID=330084 RepID=UPI0006906C7C|nr:prolyl aminopeptidase [Amycolatopsis jejuensis]
MPTLGNTAEGLLDVGDGQRVYWSTSGNPDGKPVLCVHGGPGGGGRDSGRKGFDPAEFHITVFDQRGCGRSTPNVANPAVSLEHNTTGHLIADMERLRTHLGVEKWLLYGGSWGATLILAYAQRYPERVSEIILVGTFTSTVDEVDWLYRGVGRLLPARWEAFRQAAPDPDGDLLAGYAQLLASPDRAVRLRAAHAWGAWEDAVISHETLGRPGQYSDRPDDNLVAFARLCAHYYGHHAWLDDGRLLREIHRLHGIPAVLIHGRHDLGAPLRAAWQLAQAWPDAELIVIDDSGHTGSPAMGEAVRAAIARFSPAQDPVPEARPGL